MSQPLGVWNETRRQFPGDNVSERCPRDRPGMNEVNKFRPRKHGEEVKNRGCSNIHWEPSDILRNEHLQLPDTTAIMVITYFFVAWKIADIPGALD
jgi:hypothetical protein